MKKDTIFFVDIDGTLIASDFILREDVIECAKKYQMQGGNLVLCTGRSTYGTRMIAEKLNVNVPAILFNGAAIYDFKREEILWKKPLGNEIIKYIEQIYSRNPEVCVEIFTENHIYRLRTNWMVENKGVPEERGVLVNDIPEIQEEIMKLTLIADHTEELIKCKEYFPVGTYNCEFSGKHFVEVVCADTGKHLAAKEWLRIHNNPYEIIYAAGNAKNDIGILQMSDYAFVPRTAESDVQICADYLVDGPKESGMKEAFKIAAE